MKKSSISILMTLALAGLATPALAVDYPITNKQRATADQVAQAGVPLSELAADAPDVYTVKRGDTLWAISGMYLKRPWRWPELWGMNKEQIRNPHLIYPGQVLRLVKSNGMARLEVDGSGPGGTIKLSPKLRVGNINDAITSIPANLIEPFLSQPLIVDINTFNTAPRVVATQENHLYTGAGDTIYARGLNPADMTVDYQVFRPGRPLIDPDTQQTLAYEAVYLGSASVIRVGDPATLRVKTAKEEIGPGDRLVPMPKAETMNYIPRESEKDIDGRVMSIYGGGLDQAATNMIIALNRGSNQGIERGHVMRLYRLGPTIRDTTSESGKEMVKLPDELVGQVFIFRTFDNVSYGLILNSTNTVTVGDRFSSKLD